MQTHTHTQTHTHDTQKFLTLNFAPNLDCLLPRESPVSSQKSKAIFLQSLHVKINLRKSRYQKRWVNREVVWGENLSARWHGDNFADGKFNVIFSDAFNSARWRFDNNDNTSFVTGRKRKRAWNLSAAISCYELSRYDSGTDEKVSNAISCPFVQSLCGIELDAQF